MKEQIWFKDFCVFLHSWNGKGLHRKWKKVKQKVQSREFVLVMLMALKRQSQFAIQQRNEIRRLKYIDENYQGQKQRFHVCQRQYKNLYDMIYFMIVDVTIMQFICIAYSYCYRFASPMLPIKSKAQISHRKGSWKKR